MKPNDMESNGIKPRSSKMNPNSDDDSRDLVDRTQKSDHKRRYRRRDRSDSSDDKSTCSHDSSASSNKRTKKKKKKKKVVKVMTNARLLEKLSARGETIEEREQRRSQRRAERIASHFGYTPEENPFNDPNLHETFTWKKKDERQQKKEISTTVSGKRKSRKEEQERIFQEIEAVRKRRKERELAQDEMEKKRADEARIRELAHYDEWAKKEEEFHLQQQRQRSAIRLLEHREKPIDVLAKNLLLFALDEDDKTNRIRVKYQERFDPLNELDNKLEAELIEPHVLLQNLKLHELEELAIEIETFRDLEKEASLASLNNYSAVSEMIIKYWDNLLLICHEEIHHIKDRGASYVLDDIAKLFEGKSSDALHLMKEEIIRKLDSAANDAAVAASIDSTYWNNVLKQLHIYQAKEQISEIHNIMLARQLEKLEKKKEELSNRLVEHKPAAHEREVAPKEDWSDVSMAKPSEGLDFGSMEEKLGLADEVLLGPQSFAWQEKYRPRKPRYFNRVKTGYDWNKYNQTHYDHDNPPPKTVQGYKFNIFYPDLIDKTQTAQYFIEPADSDEFCIIRFHAGPPYEDIAFKIINREWNRSRRRGFRCTFERGVLSLYFNFNTHWYRR
jgi:hypothetical protein